MGPPLFIQGKKLLIYWNSKKKINEIHSLKKKNKKLLLDLDQVSTSIFKISKHFDDLFKVTMEAAPKLLDGSKLECLKDVYVSMNNMMVSWGNTFVKQANFLQENLFYFLKYQAKQVNSFQEVKEKKIKFSYKKKSS